ncbi:MAG: hypothetical protein ACE5IP_10500 [Terriglobia bacterium]
MANYAYLSLWFRDFTIERGIAHLGALLTLFPVSDARPGFRLVIRSLDPAQSSTLEADMLAAPTAVEKLAGQFLHNDTSYEVTAWWELWQARPAATPGWEQRPAPVGLLLQGEEFDDARYRETGHVILNLGFEHLYTDPAAGAAGLDISGRSAAQEESNRRYLRENVHRLYATSAKSRKACRWPSGACGRKGSRTSPLAPSNFSPALEPRRVASGAKAPNFVRAKCRG